MHIITDLGTVSVGFCVPDVFVSWNFQKKTLPTGWRIVWGSLIMLLQLGIWGRECWKILISLLFLFFWGNHLRVFSCRCCLSTTRQRFGCTSCRIPFLSKPNQRSHLYGDRQRTRSSSSSTLIGVGLPVGLLTLWCCKVCSDIKHTVLGEIKWFAWTPGFVAHRVFFFFFSLGERWPLDANLCVHSILLMSHTATLSDA